VFAGGWTASDAASIVDADDDLGIDLLVGLESLADKSLIRIDIGEVDGETRFSMHPLLQEYALERLDASGERGAVEARHAAVFVGIAETVGGAILGSHGDDALRRLDRDQHNVRAAIDWSLRTGDVIVGQRITSATWRWYQQRGRLREARSVLAEVLARPESKSDPRLRIAGLAADGGLAYWMEDFDGSRLRYEERLRLAETLDDPIQLADAHYDIAFLYMVSWQGQQLREHAERALELYTSAGEEASVTRAHQALVLVDFLAGDYAAARDGAEGTLAAFRRAESMSQVADSLTLLAAIYAQLDDVATAWQRLTEGLRIFSERDMASGIARSLGMAAIIQIRFGEPEFGARIAGAALEFGRQKNVMIAPAKVLHLMDPDTLAVETLGTERASALLAEVAGTPIEEVIESVLAAPGPVRTSA